VHAGSSGLGVVGWRRSGGHGRSVALAELHGGSVSGSDWSRGASPGCEAPFPDERACRVRGLDRRPEMVGRQVKQRVCAPSHLWPRQLRHIRSACR
jgi:hypothetical protein